jgi:hypothetical protein
MTERRQRKDTFGAWGIVDDAEDVKEAVRTWAEGLGFFCLPEIGIVSSGRLDLLLVPISTECPIFKRMNANTWKTLGNEYHGWTERLGLVGIEVKVSSQDYQGGLKRGQFERYKSELCGLYIAGPPLAFRETDVPEQYGVLHVRNARIAKQGYASVAICRHHPTFIPVVPTIEQMWRIIWAIQKRASEDRRAEQQKEREFQDKIGNQIGHAVSRVIGQLREVPIGDNQ